MRIGPDGRPYIEARILREKGDPESLEIETVGDGLFLKRVGKTIVGAPPSGGAPGPHATTHEDGGSDEIDVTGLSGLLADPQTPLPHAVSHEDGGSDEIDVTNLSGLLGDPQTPLSHGPSHEDGGADEINVDALSGELADAQKTEVQDEGSAVGTRPAINFTGGGVLATDDPGNNRVNVEIPSVTPGDQVSVNSTPAVDADFNDTTPAAPAATGVNAKWQITGASPSSISAFLDDIKQALGQFAFRGSITPPPITGSVINYSPSGLGTCSVIRLEAV